MSKAENYLYRIISVIAFGMAIVTVVGLPGVEDKWCLASIPTWLAITFLIFSFDDPWGSKENRTDLIGLFWPVLVPMAVIGIPYIILVELFNKKSGKDMEE